MASSVATGAKRRLAAAATRHPRVTAKGAQVLRRFGLEKPAARGERAAGLAFVGPPAPARPFHLLLCGGRDQVAREISTEGWDSFEQPLPAVLARLVTTFCAGGRFADVGANTGYYSLLAASVEPTVRVDAYEPFPPVLEILRHNRSINDAARLQVHPVAVGAAPGTATLYVPLADHGLIETSSSLNPAFDDTRIGETIDVRVTTLDAMYRHDATPPAVLKIDVESLEPDVLAGGAELLERRRPILVLELLPHLPPDPLESWRARFDYIDIRLRPDAAVVGGPVTPDADAWNHLWCTAGELPGIRQLLRDAGLQIIDPG